LVEGGGSYEGILLETESGDRISSPHTIFRLACSGRDELLGISQEIKHEIDEILKLIFESKLKVFVEINLVLCW
jgi:hypothetical protein